MDVRAAAPRECWPQAAVLDYHLGEELGTSVAKALEHVGAGRVLITSDAQVIREADRVVFPGVGAIRDCMAEIRRLQNEGPTEDLVNRARESAMREHETGMKQNGYWLARLQAAKLLDRDPVAHMLERDDRIQSVSVADVKSVFEKYIPMTRYTIVTLAPE